jgi:SAM-dependent methyltransferase
MDARAPRVAGRVYRNTGNLPLLELLPAGGGRLLDCGCGAGDNARILKARGWRVTGITLSVEEQRLAAEHCERVFVTDLQQPLPEAVGAGFDVVLLSHVLEHLAAPELLLAEVKRVLSPDGVVAVALPNVLFYPVRFAALAGHFEYTEDGIMDATHVRFYTFESGAALLRANGFDLASARAEGGFPLWKLRGLLPAVLVGRIDRAACRLRPGLFGRQCLYLARPTRALPSNADRF